MIYLDYAASTPICDEALEILMNSLKDDFANPSASHKLGKNLAKKIDQSRDYFLKSLGASKNDQLIFTSSATESNNMLFNGINIDGSIFYNPGDHPSIVNPIKALKESGREVKIIPLKSDGSIDTKSFIECLDPSVGLVSLCHVNNQTGHLNDVESLSHEIKKNAPNAYIHIDGVQAYSKINLNFSKSKIDSYSISSHKIHGPKGVAALLVRQNVKLSPSLLGGGQENGLRSSTQAAPLIYAFESAAKKAFNKMSKSFEEVSRLNSILRTLLNEKLPSLKIPFSNEITSPYILFVMMPGISSDIILRHLEQKNIFISSSSACSSKVKGKNESFLAMGIEEKFHKNVLRISLSSEVTEEILNQFIDEFVLVMDDLKLYMGN